MRAPARPGRAGTVVRRPERGITVTDPAASGKAASNRVEPGRHASRAFDDSAFIRACRGEPHDHVPVWFMRQAGRALPEYRAIRERHDFEAVVHTPELAAEVTLQPVRRYGVDAAVLFSDIVTPVQGIGIDVKITPGVGPVVAEPFRRNEDLERLRPLEADLDIPYVLDTVSLLVEELEVPLIGFAGAPFTIASYLIEGGPSRSYTRTKALMFGDELTWHRLLDRLAGITLASLRAQIDRGRVGGAAVRLLGRRSQPPADYVALRAAAQPAGAPGAARLRPAPGPAGALRGEHRRAAHRNGFHRRRRRRGRLAHPAGRGAPAHPRRCRLPGQPRTGRLPRPVGAGRRARPRRPRTRRRAATTTSSTSATGCCQAPTRPSSRASWSSSTPKGEPSRLPGTGPTRRTAAAAAAAGQPSRQGPPDRPEDVRTGRTKPPRPDLGVGGLT
jgi:hypothetical protein